jgi:hypothetical protein
MPPCNSSVNELVGLQAYAHISPVTSVEGWLYACLVHQAAVWIFKQLSFPSYLILADGPGHRTYPSHHASFICLVTACVLLSCSSRSQHRQVPSSQTVRSRADSRARGQHGRQQHGRQKGTRAASAGLASGQGGIISGEGAEAVDH